LSVVILQAGAAEVDCGAVARQRGRSAAGGAATVERGLAAGGAAESQRGAAGSTARCWLAAGRAARG
jgi:hypothetical protein